MIGLKRSDLWRLIAYTLLGLLVFAAGWLGLLLLMEKVFHIDFYLSPNPSSWAWIALEFGASLWTGLFLSGLVALRLGPPKGRYLWGSWPGPHSGPCFSC